MLRIHFTSEDFARIRLARNPDPMWDIVCSLHRLQTRRGRWAFADWHRTTRDTLAGTQLGDAVRRLLVPLIPLAHYFPDFLTPHEASDGLDEGLAAIVDTPAARVAHEVNLLDQANGAPSWAQTLADRTAREELAKILRAYHEAAVAPHHDRIHAMISGERALRARETLDAGIGGLLGGLSPAMRWRPPVLHVDYVEDRDLFLAGRGLHLVPSYFCWQTPISLADPALRPVLIYPLHGSWLPAPARPPAASLAALLGRTRAAALRALALGATTSELARSLGVSPATATHHATVLRDAGLVMSRRCHNTVLHTLTPLGAALLRPAGFPGPAGAADTAGAPGSAARPGTFEPGRRS